MPPRTLLIVEDEFLIRMMLSEALADDGFQVLEAGTGSEALSLLQANPGIALMLTDLNLPGMDGVQLAQQARRSHPDLPVIFVTGRPDAIGRDELHEHDAIVAKPYLPSEIVAAARRLLER